MSYRDRRPDARFRLSPTEWAILSLLLIAFLALTASHFFATLPQGESVIRYTPAASSEQAASEAADQPVNLNTADKAALMTLPNIGETRAEAILAFREENGPFAAIEDIQLVPGIVKGIFEAIRDRITV